MSGCHLWIWSSSFAVQGGLLFEQWCVNSRWLFPLGQLAASFLQQQIMLANQGITAPSKQFVATEEKKGHCPRLVLECKISFSPWNYFRYCIILVGCTNPFLHVSVTVAALAAKYWLKHFDTNMSCQRICIKVPSEPNHSVILWSKPRWLFSVNLYLQNNCAAVCISRMC